MRLALACALLFALGHAAAADEDDNPALRTSNPALQSEQAGKQQGAPPDFWHRNTLTGDWGGLRGQLAQEGVTVTLTYTGDLLSNVLGGIKRGTTYGGMVEPQVDLDLEKLLGWKGATFRASLLQIHGEPLSPGYLGNLMPVSEIEARTTIRLYNFWLQQQAWNDRLSVRVGLFTADEEFFVSDVSDVFVNSTFGWEGWPGDELPGGGPAYPLPAPGIRLKATPAEGLTLLGAVFSGDVTGHNGNNSLSFVPPAGTVISFSGGAFFIAEADYAVNHGKGAGLPATFKLGGWYHTSGRFADQRLAANGVSLASPLAAGGPLNHKGDWGAYGIMDHMLYREAGTQDQGLSMFARAAGSPGDRNLIDFYGDTGLAYRGLLPDRPRDITGLAVAFLHIGDSARELDRDIRFFTGDYAYPIRTHEIALEATYQAPLTPWLTMQPDMQAIFNPGGHVLNPDGRIRRDALVIGIQALLAL